MPRALRHQATRPLAAHETDTSGALRLHDAIIVPRLEQGDYSTLGLNIKRENNTQLEGNIKREGNIEHECRIKRRGSIEYEGNVKREPVTKDLEWRPSALPYTNTPGSKATLLTEDHDCDQSKTIVGNGKRAPGVRIPGRIYIRNKKTGRESPLLHY